MIDHAVEIWSNSKQLEYMTLSKIDYFKLNNRIFYQYNFSDRTIKLEIFDFLKCFK